MPNVLLIWPEFPTSFWSFEATLNLVGKKAFLPPLGLLTVAGMLPRDWPARLVDCNIQPVSEEDWAWADVVFLSAMLVQKPSFAGLIADAGKRGLPVVVGGPYVTSLPEDAEAMGADYIIESEAEITLAPFLDDYLRDPGWRRGDGGAARRYSAGGAKPDLALAALPRFALADFAAYETLAVQYSRGCPFLCEFCDIISIYGRVPRMKPVAQMMAEFQSLFDLGWRGDIFLVDDNFIGHKKQVKDLLRALRDWQYDNGFPFSFTTEASIDLAADDGLIELMVQAGFKAVFLGIETPDSESLELTRKHQNNRRSMSGSVRHLHDSGLRVMAGFIIGFDNEKAGAGRRITAFAEQTDITHAFLSMLQVLPNTALFKRLRKEGRLIEGTASGNQAQLLNFVPTRPIEDLAGEYIAALEALYDPGAFAARTARMVIGLGRGAPARYRPADGRKPAASAKPALTPAKAAMMLRALAVVLRRNGFQRSSRWIFWRSLVLVLLRRPAHLVLFLKNMAHVEHFEELVAFTRHEIETQVEIHAPVLGTAERRAPPRLKRQREMVEHM